MKSPMVQVQTRDDEPCNDLDKNYNLDELFEGIQKISDSFENWNNFFFFN
jgi:hypothetical protein